MVTIRYHGEEPIVDAPDRVEVRFSDAVKEEAKVLSHKSSELPAEESTARDGPE